MSNPNHERDDEDLLRLSLSCGSGSSSSSLQRSARDSPPTNQTPFMCLPCIPAAAAANSNSRRRRRRSEPVEKSKTIPPPFPWATERRATVHRLSYLLENRILGIKGKVECKRCEKKFEMVLDLNNNLSQLLSFIGRERRNMHQRAPTVWMQPVLPRCEHCGQDNSVQPSFENTKKRNINWLFLFLGQMIGCCTLDQLKYFLKHNNIHRTGAKDRVIYYSYMCLRRQLQP